MICIAYGRDGKFDIVDGYEDLRTQLDEAGVAEVVEVATRKKYLVHEVGQQVFILNQRMQNALTSLTSLIIQEISENSMQQP